jgi:hypothetical protein
VQTKGKSLTNSFTVRLRQGSHVSNNDLVTNVTGAFMFHSVICNCELQKSRLLMSEHKGLNKARRVTGTAEIINILAPWGGVLEKLIVSQLIKILRHLWCLQVHHCVHKNLPLDPILSQLNPVHIIINYLRYILILPYCLRLVLPSGLFPLSFTPPHAYYTPLPSHLPCMITHVIFCEKYKL